MATLTRSVLDAPSKVAGPKRFLGVASNYLSNVGEGDRIHVAMKESHGNFHPPRDIENTPVIMFCDGTGLAPFRGFIQERAIQIQAGRKLVPAYIFIGCTHPDKDMLFKEELQQWEKDGVVKVFYAFSKAVEESKGCRHVPDRLWEEREEMTQAFDRGTKLYVCSSSMVGEGVAAMTKEIYEEIGTHWESQRRTKRLRLGSRRLRVIDMPLTSLRRAIKIAAFLLQTQNHVFCPWGLQEIVRGFTTGKRCYVRNVVLQFRGKILLYFSHFVMRLY
jgi:sulfite reductase alpha subunit-like flavoprotein